MGNAAYGGLQRLDETVGSPVAGAATMLGNGVGALGRGIRNLYGGGERPAAPVPAGDPLNYNMF